MYNFFFFFYVLKISAKTLNPSDSQDFLVEKCKSQCSQGFWPKNLRIPVKCGRPAICFVSKKQGVAHAEASFLGGREKQNGLVDVQWEKGVKK